jgi:predicted metal-dependent enzyme (double-stranded beta helix superfamily)
MSRTKEELPDRDSLHFLFDAIIEDITDVMAEGTRHEEVHTTLTQWILQLTLLNSMYEASDESTLDLLRARLGQITGRESG